MPPDVGEHRGKVEANVHGDVVTVGVRTVRPRHAANQLERALQAALRRVRLLRARVVDG